MATPSLRESRRATPLAPARRARETHQHATTPVEYNYLPVTTRLTRYTAAQAYRVTGVTAEPPRPPPRAARRNVHATQHTRPHRQRHDTRDTRTHSARDTRTHSARDAPRTARLSDTDKSVCTCLMCVVQPRRAAHTYESNASAQSCKHESNASPGTRSPIRTRRTVRTPQSPRSGRTAAADAQVKAGT